MEYRLGVCTVSKIAILLIGFFCLACLPQQAIHCRKDETSGSNIRMGRQRRNGGQVGTIKLILYRILTSYSPVQ